MDMQLVTEKAEKRIEKKIDSVLLSRKCDPALIEELDSSLFKTDHLEYFKILISDSLHDLPKTIQEPPVSLGSYLTSRLMRQSFKFEFDKDCLYALSDAVRGPLPIEIFRWRFILEWFTKRGVRNFAVTQLLHQSSIVMKTLSKISDNEDLRREIKVLDIKNITQ